MLTSHVVETTRDVARQSLVIGNGDWLPVLEDRLLGLKAGAARRFEMPPPMWVCRQAPAPQVMPRDDFPELKLEAGQVIGFTLPSGEEIPGTVLEVSEY